MNMQNVFQQSPVNGGAYNEVEPCAWSWPSGTWLQRRRARLAKTKKFFKPAPKRIREVLTMPHGMIKLAEHMEGKSNGLARRRTLER